MPGFTWVQASVLAWQALYLLSHFPPLQNIVMKRKSILCSPYLPLILVPVSIPVSGDCPILDISCE